MEYDFEKDLPIADVKQDILGRNKFAQNLSNAIIHYTENSDNNDCLVIGLEGEWGSGKTSFFNLMEPELKNHFIIRHFNPWISMSEVGLTADFFSTINQALADEKSSLHSIVQEYSKKLLLGTATVLDSVKGSSIKDLLDVVLKDERSLYEQKKDMQKALASRTGKWIIVFIDDIDRLSDEEISLVFKLIKNVADFPKIIYVLAYDKLVVEKALGNVQAGRGVEYLHKVIQLPYEIPLPDDDDLFDYTLKRLASITGNQKYFEEERFNELYNFGVQNYLKNIRDCNRVCNSFSMKYSSCGNECDLIDLFAVTVLEIFESRAFHEIRNNREYMLGFYKGRVPVNQESMKFFISELLHLVSSGHLVWFERIINLLFPGFWERGEKENYLTSVQERLPYKRICEESGFDRYFSLSIGKKEIPTFEIDKYMEFSHVNVMTSYLQKWNEEGKIRKGLKRIDYELGQWDPLEKEIDLLKLKNIFEAFSNVVIADEYEAFGFSNLFYKNAILTKALRLCLGEQTGKFWDMKKLIEIFTDDSINLSNKWEALTDAGSGKKWIYGGALKDLTPVLGDDDFKTLCDVYLKCIKDSDDETILNEENADWILYFWYKTEELSFHTFIESRNTNLKMAEFICPFICTQIPDGQWPQRGYYRAPFIKEVFDIEAFVEPVRRYLNSGGFRELQLEKQYKIAAFYLLHDQDIETRVDLWKVKEYISSLETEVKEQG